MDEPICDVMYQSNAKTTWISKTKKCEIILGLNSVFQIVLISVAIGTLLQGIHVDMSILPLVIPTAMSTLSLSMSTLSLSMSTSMSTLTDGILTYTYVYI